MKQTFINHIKDQIQETESLKNHIVQIKEDTERDELTLVISSIHDIITVSELLKIMNHTSCDLITTYNNNLVIRLF